MAIVRRLASRWYHRRWNHRAGAFALLVGLGCTGMTLAPWAVADEVKVPEPPAFDKDELLDEGNPYLAPTDASAEELQQFLVRMAEKQDIIRQRAGFAEAVVDAADRLIAKDPGKEIIAAAIVAKMNALHDKAVAGDVAADESLRAMVTEFANAKEPQVAEAVRLYALERKVIEADNVPADKLADLLPELKTYFEETKLGEQHLRIASGTVRIINRLPDDAAAQKAYEEFGNLFAKSRYRQLKSYGMKIAEGTEGDEGSEAVRWAGKPMELEGKLVSGEDFDWKSYRGKIVVVDFWATWCGPCRAAMPELIKLYDEKVDSGFTVVGVSLDKDMDALDGYLKEQNIPWQTVADNEASMAMAKRYKVSGIPSTFLIDGEGKIVATNLHGDALKEKIDELIAALPK